MKDYASASTKTKALILQKAENISSIITAKAQEIFMLSTDGSNDNAEKFFSSGFKIYEWK